MLPERVPTWPAGRRPRQSAGALSRIELCCPLQSEHNSVQGGKKDITIGELSEWYCLIRLDKEMGQSAIHYFLTRSLLLYCIMNFITACHLNFLNLTNSSADDYHARFPIGRHMFWSCTELFEKAANKPTTVFKRVFRKSEEYVNQWEDKE